MTKYLKISIETLRRIRKKYNLPEIINKKVELYKQNYNENIDRKTMCEILNIHVIQLNRLIYDYNLPKIKN